MKFAWADAQKLSKLRFSIFTCLYINNGLILTSNPPDFWKFM